MHRYSKTGVDTSRTACAKGADLRVHFKNTAETAAAVRNMNVDKAIAYLEAVMDHKRCIHLLKNAKANAEKKGLDTDNLVIVHAQVNQAPRGRRRTYRAHGRINAYMSSPSHIEVIVEDKSGDVPAAIEDSKVRKLSKVQRARALRSGATSA
jgi:large subunit ribosomal protein L17e